MGKGYMVGIAGSLQEEERTGASLHSQFPCPCDRAVSAGLETNLPLRGDILFVPVTPRLDLW
jgi:hypothetical protein